MSNFVRFMSKHVQIRCPGYVQNSVQDMSRICPGYVQNSVQDMSRTVSRMCPEHVKWTNGSRVHSILVDCPKCPLDMDVYWTSCGQRVLHSDLICYLVGSRGLAASQGFEAGLKSLLVPYFIVQPSSWSSTASDGCVQVKGIWGVGL